LRREKRRAGQEVRIMKGGRRTVRVPICCIANVCQTMENDIEYAYSSCTHTHRLLFPDDHLDPSTRSSVIKCITRPAREPILSTVYTLHCNIPSLVLLLLLGLVPLQTEPTRRLWSLATPPYTARSDTSRPIPRCFSSSSCCPIESEPKGG
jgi:hypothetical protein